MAKVAVKVKKADIGPLTPENALSRAPDCPMCGSRPGSVSPYLNPSAEHGEVFANRFIAICDTCGFGNSFPKIAGSDLGPFYEGNFLPRYQARVAKGDWPFLDERSLAQISIARLFAEFEPGDGFLDLGPGVGISFFTATQLLESPKLFGVEMNQTTIGLLEKNLPEVKIVSKTTEIPAVAGSTPITLALTSHCLEHFNGEDVIPGLKEVYDVMAPGGILIVEVPHWDFRRFSARKNDVPHLCFFSGEALANAVQNSGFELMYLRAFGIPQGAPKDFEIKRRQKYDRKLMTAPAVSIHQLMVANSPDNMPRDNGKLLRAIGRKPA